MIFPAILVRGNGIEACLMNYIGKSALPPTDVIQKQKTVKIPRVN